MHDLPVLRVTAKRFDGDLVSHAGNLFGHRFLVLKYEARSRFQTFEPKGILGGYWDNVPVIVSPAARNPMTPSAAGAAHVVKNASSSTESPGSLRLGRNLGS